MMERKIIVKGRQIELASDKDRKVISAYFKEHSLNEPGYTGSNAVKINGMILIFRCYFPDPKLPLGGKQVFVYDTEGNCLSSSDAEDACKALRIPSDELEHYSSIIDFATASYIDGMYVDFTKR